MVPSVVLIYSAVSFTYSRTPISRGRASFSWEKYPIRTVSPISIWPESGFIRPQISFIRVDLPQPLGPVIPILSVLRKL